ncbi:MAG: phosphatase PAP2 family protein [Chloroflexi bacterium]|jgi:undecaprenyl-diphosphatase|nr:phosphatase PAP2 family protein [Chloroflexota bacterium]MBT7079899.1 phosphatase PAP2 family protein [Chloroflexota bacterium]
MRVSPDWQLFEWINGLTGNNDTVDNIIKFIANDYFITVTIVLILLGVWFGARSIEQRKRNQWGVVWAAVGVGFTSLFIHILNRVLDIDLWFRPYDDGAGHAVNRIFGYAPSDPSFPANSAAVAFAFATGVFMANRKAGVVMYCIGALWGFSRVFSGIHYPLDIIGGAAIAIIITYVMKKALPLLEPLPTLFLAIPKKLHLSDIPVDTTINWRPVLFTKWWQKS